MSEKRTTILGAGSWGTALAVLLAEKRRRVVLWARRIEQARLMRETRSNPTYLPGIQLPETVHITADLREALQEADMLVVATPSHAVRQLAERMRPYVTAGMILVSVTKGIAASTLKTVSQILIENLPQIPETQLCVLHGPSHAEEVARQKPTTVVAASPELETARRVQERFMTPMFRVYTNTDLLGVEIAGAVKNVLAIAAGICDGLQLGDNAKAALITRGLAEMARLGVAMGASPLTFAGLAGIGDLVVTCMSRHSRNRYVGEQLGQGRTLEEILSEMSMVAEGVRTAISVRALAQRYGVEMPIATAVYEILFAGKSPQQALEELMSRAAKEEYWTGPLAAYSS